VPPDVLIVGAGPAGCTAAIVLARAGIRVRVIDRERFPRDKLCGDTVNPGTMALLERLHPAATAAIRARSLLVSGMMVTGPHGTSVTAEYPPRTPGVALSRRELDAQLLEAAVAAGADVVTGVRARRAVVADDRVCGVEVASGSSTAVLPAKVVIAADGRRSTLSFGLGLARFATRPRRWAFGAYFAGIDGLSSRGEMHVRRDGYIGVAPLPEGIANVCVVRDGRPRRETLRDRQSGPNGTPQSVIGDAVGADPLLRDRFRRAQQISGVTTLGPLAVDASAAGCPGLLLAGDAAGFVDPMTGDGLRFAVRGGQLAAAAALRELTTGRPAFEQLGAARAAEFGRKWRFNRALRALAGSPRGVLLAASVAHYWSAPIRALVGIAGDLDLARGA
jgi:flavin-dependent dehydrogenase